MGQSRDYVALDWIKSEIETTLGHARQALEAYADTPDSTRMRACLTYIHQVHGTLQMVELHGLAELSEEMEQLAQAMMNNDVESSERVHQVLMRSILELPAFLERVRLGDADSAQAVRPLVNELRGARGASLLQVDEPGPSEPSIDLSPLRDGVHAATLKNFDDANGQVRAQKMRRAFQQSLLALHRGEEINRVYVNLAKLFITLARLCAGSAHGYQWAAFAALAEALAKGTLELEDPVVALLRRVDAEIKKLALRGHSAVSEPVDEALMRDVLSVLAQVQDRSSVQRDILKRFGVGVERPTQAPSAGDREAIAAAAAGLREELAKVVDKIDLFVRSQDRNHAELSELVPMLKEMATTLKMTGLTKLQRRLMEQMVLLQAFAQKGGDDAKLMDIAAGLLRVDSSLERMVSSGGKVVREDADVQLTDAQEGVIREARAGLEQIKEAIVEFIASQWNYEKLSDVPAVMSSVRGALLIVPVPRAAELLDACRKHVEDELIGNDGAPDWPMLDTLADAITSIDYYLERLSEDPTRPDERILDVAAGSVAHLGRGPGGVIPEEADAGAPTVMVDLPSAPASSEGSTATEPETTPDGTNIDTKSAAPRPVVSEDPVERSDVDVGDEFLIDESFLRDDEDGADAPDALSEQEGSGPDARDDLDALELDASDGTEQDEPIAENQFEDLTGEDASSRDAVDEIDADPAFMIDGDDLERGEHEATDESVADDAKAGEFLMDSDFDAEAIPDAPLESAIEDGGDAPAEFLIDESFDGDARRSDEEDLDAFSIDDDLEEAPSDPPTVMRQEQRSGETGQADAPDEFILDDSFETDGGEVAADQPSDDADVEETPSPQTADAGVQDESLSEATVHGDPEIVEIFLQEVGEVMQNLARALPTWRADLENAVALGDVRRAFHTLKGSGRMVGASLLSELSWSIENMLNRVIDGTVSPSPEMANLVGEVCEALPHLRSAFENRATPEVDPAPYMERADLLASGVAVGGDRATTSKAPSDESAQSHDGDEAKPASLAAYPPDAPTIVRRVPAEMDESLLAIFEEESAGHLGIIERCIEQRATIDDSVVRAIHNLKGSAAIADIVDVMGIAAPLEDFVRELVENDEDDDDTVYSILDAGVRAIRACLSALREGGDPAPEITRFHDVLSQGETGLDEDAASDASHPTAAASDVTEKDASRSRSLPDPTETTIELPENLDPEVLEIFHEESEELLEGIDRSIQEWLEDRTSGEHLDALLRALHTLKGGARLAGLVHLGDYTHRFESHLIEQQPNVGHLGDAFFVDLQSRHDMLVGFVTAIRSAAPGERIVIEGRLDGESDEGAWSEPAVDGAAQAEDVDGGQAAAPHNVIPFATRGAKDGEEESPASKQSDRILPKHAPQEMVRVASTLLDDLVNLAGETSIHRARVEQEIRDFGDALDETETTIERLRDQLRRLEVETDAQVIYRRERSDGPGYTEFDPLEMDRYSQLQQLSRSLLESASDLVDLKETLSGRTRDAETLLAHQARINTELQEGLMRTRMVPFERLVPRLRRIVRQIGRELNKEVTFEAFDAEGELDRNVLERMIPPLEHMLRNAVDHGIESPEERTAAGKPANGKITLRLSREGGDIVIEIADDGRGVNVDKVREKAVELGLMPEDANLGDDDIVQFIMAPGFSTADNVTQISGRGVGMDVAVSEVKMLGGEISIVSDAGKGTTFTVRLPFTVSVNRALMVQIGEDTYAIPLNTIEGIVRVLPKDLEPYLDQSATTFEYAGERYRIRYLGSYVGREHYTRSDALSVPVLLVRTGDEAVALFVDAVLGSREIVVKGLGPQFASVGGISGATILGDGSVVVILDPPGLIRAELSARLRPAEVTARREGDVSDRQARVMVVDDSVTVRKVTSRVLERNGFEVMLAKDGIDAIAMLHQRQPDIMLLDIEMPRMDGFEVARQVRRDERLKDIPIVIISSRTGAKHQERARELGVDVFLGKPFQETELMKIINKLVK